MTLNDRYRMKDNDWWYLVEATICNLKAGKRVVHSGFKLEKQDYTLLNPDKHDFTTADGMKIWTIEWAKYAKRLKKGASYYNARGNNLSNAVRIATQKRAESNVVWMCVGRGGGVKTRVRGKWTEPKQMPSEQEWLDSLPEDDKRKSRDPNLYNFRNTAQWVVDDEGKYVRVQVEFNYWYQLEAQKNDKEQREWQRLSNTLVELQRSIPLPDYKYMAAFMAYDPGNAAVLRAHKDLQNKQEIFNNWNDPQYVEEYRLKQVERARGNLERAQQQYAREVEISDKNLKELEELA